MEKTLKKDGKIGEKNQENTCMASSPQAGAVQAVLTSLQGCTQSCSAVSRRLLPTGVLRRRQTDSVPRHATISSSTGPPRSSVLGHSLSPLHPSGTGCRITSAPSSRSTPSKSHWRLTCLTARDWILTAAQTMRQSSTVWLLRALVTSSSCYGVLEIVWLLLLLLLNWISSKENDGAT